MAEQKRSRRYRTYGSVAYQPETEQESVKTSSRQRQVRGNAARRPEPARRPRITPRKRPKARPEIRVRSQSAVAPFAVVGLFSVLACTLLLVMSMARRAGRPSGRGADAPDQV